ncbi:MAG TPA: tRNA pseudouridine(38-40) synthase TruA [Magnetospirillaceae bacterium]|jgi:tRNA pseudouridine38-40 synthase
MTRFKITIEYDGTTLAGWQRQDNGPTVQAGLEAAAAKLVGQAVEVIGAGRTDAGVHASGQVAHLDIEKDLTIDAVRDGLNFWLRETGTTVVVVKTAEVAAPDFHARFSAVERRYIYRVLNRRVSSPLDRDRVWWVPTALDAAAMQEAAKKLEGKHDFSTFRAAECQAASPVKTLDRLEVTRIGDELRIDARARSFLHHQVRNLVGSLKLVGEGRWSVADLVTALEAKDRTKGGPTAPAAGLTLVEVVY